MHNVHANIRIVECCCQAPGWCRGARGPGATPRRMTALHGAAYAAGDRQETPMKAGVLKETWPGETRVAVVPGVVPALAKAGIEVVVEAGAGDAAGFPDAQYAEKGAALASARPRCWRTPRSSSSVRSFSGGQDADAIGRLEPRHVVIGFLDPLQRPEGAKPLAARGVDVLRPRARAPHLARPEHGRAVLDRHDGRLQGRAPRRRRAAPHDADDDDRRRHRGPGARLRDRRRRRRPAGHRHRPPPRGRGRGLRRAARGEGAGPAASGRSSSSCRSRRRPPRTRAATRRRRTRASTAASASCWRRSWRRATS